MSTVWAIAMVAVQVLTGAAVWALIRRGPSVAELLGMGVAIGTFASMLSAVVVPSAGFAWALPTLVTAITLVPCRRRLVASLRSSTFTRPQLAGLLLGLGAGLLVIGANWLRTPLGAVSDRSYTDIYFLEGLSRGIASFGPGESILMTGSALRYHWFTYAWAGELTQSAGLSPFVSLTRLLPITAMLGLVLLALAWTDLIQVKRNPRWVPALAALSVAFAGYAGALYGSILNFDSPSQSLTTVWLMALGLAFVRYVRGGSTAMAVTAVALTAAVVGGKVSHAAVGLAGMAGASIVGLASRSPWRKRALIVTLFSLVAAGATYLLVLSGAAIDRNLTEDLAVKASTWQGLDPLIGRWGMPAGTAALLLAMLARPAGLAWLLRKRSGWADPAVIFALGGLLAGIGALVALRGGVNETWFVLGASGAAAAVAAVGAGQAMSWAHRNGTKRPLAKAVLIAVPATAASLVLSANWPVGESVWPPGTGTFSVSGLLHWSAVVGVWLLVGLGALWIAKSGPPGRRRGIWLAFAVTALTLTAIGTRPAALWTTERQIQTETGVVRPTAGGEGASTADLDGRLQAVDWLLSRADTADIVATSDPGSAFIPAYTGLRMFLGGARYQEGLGDARDLAEVQRRIGISSAIAAGPSDQVIADLCAAGVRWVWLEGKLGDWDAGYQGRGVGIVDLAPRCR